MSLRSNLSVFKVEGKANRAGLVPGILTIGFLVAGCSGSSSMLATPATGSDSYAAPAGQTRASQANTVQPNISQPKGADPTSPPTCPPTEFWDPETQQCVTPPAQTPPPSGGGGGTVAKGADCTGAKANNTTAVPGSSNHNDMIATGDTAMLSITFSDNVSEDVAFEYQTYGGQEYVQFFVTGSGSVSAGPFGLSAGGTHSPMVPFNGNAYAALQLAAKAEGMSISALPTPLSQIMSGMTFVRTPCNANTIQTG